MEKKLEKIKRKVLRKYPAFNILTANLEIKVNDSVFPSNVQTCMTNGKDIYVHSKFLKEQSEDVLVFAIAHELGHIAFNHIDRIEGKDPKLWNYACDAVLNQLLSNDGLDIPSFAIDEKEAASYSVDEYYNKLLDKQNEEEQNDNSKNRESNQENDSNGGESNQENDPNDNSNDETNTEDINYGHDLWESKNNKQDENNKQDIDEQKEFKKNKKQRLQNTNEILKKISEDIKNYDEGSNQEIDTSGYSKPLIDWRYLLREALESSMDWSYSNAEFEYGVLTPQLMYYPEPTCEILLDTSGSISKTLLKNFLLECKNIMQTSKVKVGCFDVRFYGWKIINSIEEIENLKFRGGGLTSFDVAVKAFTPRVENKIIFTDGEATMPKVQSNIIWIVFGNTVIKPLGGKVIYVDVDKLNDKPRVKTK